ncbi:MAG TPA: CopD family protein, partial [Herpetosiphonaceae bacterium]
LTFSASGHAAGAAIPALAIGADWVHLLAGAAWLGGLLGLTGLAWQTRRLPAAERRPLLASLAGSFSRVALWSVALVVATGVLRSLDHLPTLAAAWQTPYGRTLLVKTGLLAAALGFGAFHWRRAGRASATAATTPRRFGRTLAAESALAAGVLVVASALVQTPHPVTAAAKAAARPEIITFSPLALKTERDGLAVALSLDDRRPGLRAFSVTVADAGGRPVAADRIMLRFKAKEIELGEEALVLERQADGVWSGMSEAIRTLGRWELAVQVRRAGQPDVLALFDVEITR